MTENIAIHRTYVHDNSGTTRERICITTESTDGLASNLGLKHEGEGERRKYFTKLLNEKLREQRFRQIDEFPVAEIENSQYRVDVIHVGYEKHDKFEVKI